MDTTIIGAIIVAAATIIGAVLGVVLTAFFPAGGFTLFARRILPGNRMIGVWDSYWGPGPAESSDGVKKYREVITITKQRGERFWGTSKLHDDETRVWDIEGRYSNRYFQAYFYPSRTSPNTDFQDYGCYFLVREGRGYLRGFSASYGEDPETHQDTLTTEHHLMIPRRLAQLTK